MSANSLTSTLPSPLRDLVATACPNDEDFGSNEKDKAEVVNWIQQAASGSNVKSLEPKELDAHLTPKTFLVGNRLTAADVAVYGALHPTVKSFQPQQYYALPALTRYFDHIQSRPSVRKAADSVNPPLASITFELDNMPKLERKADPPKKKEKPAKAEGATQSADAGAASKEGKAQKKEKKEPKEKGQAAASEGGSSKKGAANAGNKAAAVAEDSGEPVPSMIDLRVGHILDVQKHPDADGLYIEQIDIGEETGPRTVVSGLVHYIPIEQMRDKYLVAVCNLKPANMRGVKSFAMVLCATSKDGKEAGIELIQPPPGSKPGDRVYFEGEKYESASPLSQLNPKKKIFETIQPGFTTLESKEAAWVDPATKSVHKIRTKNGVCVAPTLIGASLS
ncbi:nucleic acid-binding protein [Schizopora paradoxa]|uniref:Nucleic acid-binding protein n=1 Tax=Schizopora paradoxa TaxID=27342 RepID=A0A0H2S3D9_9AGAM|nr:nucleic acid-binding protein [Schizopora paradoxa]